MITFSTMRTAIKTWIDNNSGSIAIRANQNAPAPGEQNSSYFTFLINSFSQVGREDMGSAGTPDTEIEILSNHEFTLEVQAFGANAVELAVNLRNSLNNPNVHDQLRDDGSIVVFDVTPILDISAIDPGAQTKFEERASFDVMCRTNDIISDVPVGRIQIVEMEGTYILPDESEIVQEVTIDGTI